MTTNTTTQTRQEFMSAFEIEYLNEHGMTADNLKKAHSEARKAWKALPDEQKGSARGSWETFRAWLEEAPRTKADLEAWLKEHGSDRQKKSATLKAEFELAQRIWAKAAEKPQSRRSKAA